MVDEYMIKIPWIIMLQCSVMVDRVVVEYKNINNEILWKTL